MKNKLIYIYDKYLLVLFYIFRIFPIKQNKIVVSNFYGRGVGDNAKYILNELNLDEFDIYWVVGKEKTFIPNNFKKIRFHRSIEVFHLATAKIWIDNSRKLPYVRKRKGQFYIQTWHGGLAFKKIEYDAIDKLGKNYIKIIKNDSKMIDLMTSNSIFCTNMFRRAFLYKGEVLEEGSPRNDILLMKNDDIIKKIKEYYQIGNKNVCLYAPTYRNDKKNNVYNIDYSLLLNTLNNKTNSEWVILFKCHPSMLNNNLPIKNNKNIINVSNYDDMQELICACDILITDYSSTMFEAMIAKKPVFLYASDINEYYNERGFYFRFDELPLLLAENNNKLNDNIKKTNLNNYINNYNLFFKKVGLKESGNASKKIAKIIKDIR